MTADGEGQGGTMASFATKEQYVARFGPVADESVLQECLDDASAAIRAALDRAGMSYEDPDEEFADRLMRVCRSVAKRIMPAPATNANSTEIPFGATQMSQSAGSYNRQFTFRDAYGTPKLLPSELELLGVYASHGGAAWSELAGGPC